MLEINNLSKIYSSGAFKKKYNKALDNVGIKVNMGKILGIVGESGSGKSTLAMCIARLIEPTEGKIIYNGLDITSLSKKELNQARKKVQVIFQDPESSLNPRKTVGDSIAEAIKISNSHDRNYIKKEVLKLLEIVGLSKEHVNRYPSQLSGGQNQRIVIARALALEPSLIIADEPTSALDVSVQAQIFKLLKEIKEKNNLTMVLISHDLDIVKNICDDMAIMYKGKILEQGRVQDIIKNPKHSYTKVLMNCTDENILNWQRSLYKENESEYMEKMIECY